MNYSDSNIQEFDLKELFRFYIKLWPRFLLSLLILCPVFLGLSYFFPKEYKSDIILSALGDEQSFASSILSNSPLSGISNLSGFDLSSNPKLDQAVTILNSRIIIKKLLEEKSHYRQEIFAAERFDRNTLKTIFDKNLYDSTTNKWVRNIPNKDSIPSDFEVYQKIKESLIISVNSKNDFIYISFTHVNPLFASEFLETFVRTTDSYFRKKDIADFIALEIQLVDSLSHASHSFLRDSMNKLLELNMKKLFLAKTKKQYIFEILDPAITPEIHFFPNKLVFLLLGLFFGISIFFLYATFKFYYK